MSYQQALDDHLARGAARIERLETKIVTLDIERLPGRYEVRGYRSQHTVTGPFWDLSDGKRLIGYRLRPEHVIEWPSTITVAWRWYGEERVHAKAVWGNGGKQGLLETMWETLDRADIIVGHNAKRFDLPKIEADLIVAGFPPPRPYKVVDTLLIARSRFGFESNTLDSLAKRLGVQSKSGHYDAEQAARAVAGSKRAQSGLLSYNKGDIVTTEAVYDRLRPWAKNHPHVAALTTNENGGVLPQCHACGSTRLERNGHYTAQVLKYGLYRCQNCWANVADRTHAGASTRVATTRGV